MLDVSLWFPGGARSARVRVMPGTSFALPNGYCVYVTSNEMAAPKNQSVMAMFHREWFGNIVVVKLADLEVDKVINFREDNLIMTDVIMAR